MGITYEKQYQALRIGAIAEENRRKQLGRVVEQTARGERSYDTAFGGSWSGWSYSNVTDFTRFLGRSTSRPFFTVM